ncbi:sensor histidine kinase [Puerhibacterium puerhi]|uniref:sensor histidine kinase n=1 Tax=Puerhibacterium puerhi TaxID=2692623 RepID=UPI001359A8F0|nr:histidine kinase [Puerhibacterium puerhi]
MLSLPGPAAGPAEPVPPAPGPPPGPLDRRRPRVFLAVAVALVSVVGTLGAAYGPGRWGGWGPRHAPSDAVAGTAGVLAARPLDAGAFLLVLVAPAAMVVLLPRWQRTATVVTVAATGAYLLVGYPWGPVIAGATVLLAAVVLSGPAHAARRTAWAGGALLAGAVWSAAALRGDSPAPGGLAGGAAWAAVALLVVSALRDRLTRAAEARAAAARSLAERQRTAVAAERLRIAREMHDVLAHSLSAITVQAGVGLHLLDRDPAQARTALTNIRDTSRQALDEVRLVLGVVRAGGEDAADGAGPADAAASLAPTWTLAALPRLVELAGTQTRAARLVVDPAARDLPEHLAGVVYRVVQESLTNVRRHAPAATRVDVAVAVAGGRLVVTVDDDGGATAPPGAAGYGLLGMRERVEGVGGVLDAGPTAAGWRTRATLPWPGAGGTPPGTPPGPPTPRPPAPDPEEAP